MHRIYLVTIGETMTTDQYGFTTEDASNDFVAKFGNFMKGQIVRFTSVPVDVEHADVEGKSPFVLAFSKSGQFLDITTIDPLHALGLAQPELSLIGSSGGIRVTGWFASEEVAQTESQKIVNDYLK